MAGSMNPFNSSFWGDAAAYAARHTPTADDIWYALHGKATPSAIAHIKATEDALSIHANTYQEGPKKGQYAQDPNKVHDQLFAAIDQSNAYSNRLADKSNDNTLLLIGGVVGLGLLFVLSGGKKRR